MKFNTQSYTFDHNYLVVIIMPAPDSSLQMPTSTTLENKFELSSTNTTSQSFESEQKTYATAFSTALECVEEPNVTFVQSKILGHKNQFTNKNNIAKLNWWYAQPNLLHVLDDNIEEKANTKQCTREQTSQDKAIAIPAVTELTLQYHKNQGEPVVENLPSNPKNFKEYKERQVFSPNMVQHNNSACQLSYENYCNDDCISQDSQLLTQDEKPSVGIINQDEEDEMQVTGYRSSKIRLFLCWFFICLTGGILRLILHWFRHWYLIATHKQCPLEEANKVLVQENYQGKHKTFYVKKVKVLDASTLRLQNKFEEEEKERGSGDTEKNIPDVDIVVHEKGLHLPVHFSSAKFKNLLNVRTFNCKQLRYVWDIQSKQYRKLKGLDVDVSSVYYHQQKGLSLQEQTSRRLVYGKNEITVPYKDIKTLLFLEVLNPFYIFQIFSVILWFTYNYYYYACVIIFMSVFGISMSIYQMKKNQDALRETVKNTGCALVVNSKGEVREVQTKCLVPGDIIEIPTNGCTMQCDAILLSGNCILDESMLTGESVPVTKTPLPFKRDVVFDKKEHARHTLFCGTKVIQTRYIGSEKVLAIVINTGNITAKGGLIRSILYPPPVDYKFEQDSYKFIEFLALIALIGFIYTLVTKILRGIDPVKIAVESLDLITIVVPPALPAAMTVGRLYAQKRLEKANIYCISPRSINVAGSIDCCCFDKTGTLTEDGLDMWGVVPKSSTNQFQIPINQIERLPYDNFLFCMVTCHSITIMNGKKVGDPLDLKMFESTGWLLEDQKDIPDSQKYGLLYPTIVRQPKATGIKISNSAVIARQSSFDDLLADIGLLDGETNNDHGIVREFPFSSNLQRMSVITRRLCEKNFNVYCKGSPEMLQQLCLPSSLPDNFSQQLATFAKQGYRVIALSYKSLSSKINYTKAQRLLRESVESDLEFLGFVVLENRLKPDTTKVIDVLSKANMRTIMITGDNLLTALSVARDCGIVSANQPVITVNVRSRVEEQMQHQILDKTHNYELYYTLDLGSKECTLDNNLKQNNGFHNNKHGNYGDIDFESCNGDLSITNSIIPNSNSLTSVQTCDTWTHRDVELASSSAIDKNFKTAQNSFETGELSWRRNYRFAMAGKTWQVVRDHFPVELRYFITRCAIFARMSPEQKQSLVMELQNLDYCVAMCGDGANDCGALKVAHAGISLSETESSIASPFTSKNATIACVPNVIMEGRAALVTSFGIFKYMAAYSMVQFISVMILYSIDSNLTDKQYLYIDLGLISIFAFFFGKTEAYKGALVKQAPLVSLISLTPISSLLLHLLVVVAFQVTAWFHLQLQPWFKPYKPSDEQHLGCHENYVMFAVSSFQYIALAFVFSKGAPYRRTILSNLPLCLTLLFNLLFLIYLILYPPVWLANTFQLIIPPEKSFCYWMIFYGAINFSVHVFVEELLVEFCIFKKVHVRRENNVRTTKRKHLQVEYELQCSRNWPQITETYKVYESSSHIEDSSKPTYVEISAEQNIDSTATTHNPLEHFFEIDTGLNLATETKKSVIMESA